jgi:hypothetical protein
MLGSAGKFILSPSSLSSYTLGTQSQIPVDTQNGHGNEYGIVNHGDDNVSKFGGSNNYSRNGYVDGR